MINNGSEAVRQRTEGGGQVTIFWPLVIAMTPEERIEQKRARKAETNKQYWAKHCEEIAQKRNVKVECPTCGKQVMKRHLDRHLESKNHTKTNQECV